MTINVRQKGQEGEREIARMLNAIVATVRKEQMLPRLDTRDELFQRNQNQSAVGGADLSNPLHLEIEVKRQEQLSINTWWKQCTESAARTGGVPILIFRQNRKAWRVMLPADLPIQSRGEGRYSCIPNVRAEIDIETFKLWFKEYYKTWICHREG